MLARVFAGFLAGAACVLFASLSRAQCTKDNECPGDLVCEESACVAAPPAPPPAPAPTRVAAPAAPAPEATPSAVAQSIAAEPPEPEPEAPVKKPEGKRHSTGMMVGGIVMTSLSFFPLLVMAASGLSNDSNKARDAFVGGFVGFAVLAGIGIPLIVIGARREPAPTARVAPWVTPHSAGLGLRFDL